MPSERIQRQIDALLDQAEAAVARQDWAALAGAARAVLAIDVGNEDARAFLAMAEANLGGAASTPPPEARAAAPTAQPESFAAERYHVRRVFVAHDESLDRDVAFALIETEGLDATDRERIVSEAQAMGRLGAHPHVVTTFEIGEEADADDVPRSGAAARRCRPRLVLGVAHQAPDHLSPRTTRDDGVAMGITNTAGRLIR